MKTKWNDKMDEAILRTLKQGLTDGRAFFNAYVKESGDTVHAIGGMMFRLETMSRILRLDVPDALFADLKRLSNIERDARKAAKMAPAPKTPAQKTATTAVPAYRATSVTRDGKEWIVASVVAEILGCTPMEVRGHNDGLVWRDDIHPKGHGRKVYARDSVVAYTATRAAGGQALSAAKASSAPSAPAPKVAAPTRVTVKGVEYGTIAEAAAILGCSDTQVRNGYGRDLTTTYGIHPSRPSSPMYLLSEVEAVAKRRKAVKDAEVARLAELRSETPTIDGEVCMTVGLAAKILGKDSRAVGALYGHRLVRKWHASRTGVGFFTRASLDTLKAELDAEVARKALAAKAAADVLAAQKAAPVQKETPPAPPAEAEKSNGHATPTNGAAKPKVMHMDEMTLAQKLDTLNRALAAGVIDEHTHANKVRVVAAGG